MLAREDEIHYLLEQRAVFLVALGRRHHLGVLLYAPHCPEHYVGLLYLVDVHAQRPARHKVAYGLGEGAHVGLVKVYLAYVEREARHGHQHVPRPAFEPRPARYDVAVVAVLDLKLMGGVDETLVEIVDRLVLLHFLLHLALHLRGVHLRESGAEHDLLALAYLRLEVARDKQVLVGIVSALAFARIVEAAIPRRGVDKGALLVHLHVEFRIAGVKAHPDAALHLAVVGVCGPVLMGKLGDAPEGEERPQAQRGARVGVEQRVADEYARLSSLKRHLLLQHDAAHTVDGRRHLDPFEMSDIFVSLGTEVIALVFVQRKVELGPVLYHRLVERGEKHMILVVHVGNGHNKQTVIFPDIAAHQCRRRISSALVREENLLVQAFLEIGHL